MVKLPGTYNSWKPSPPQALKEQDEEVVLLIPERAVLLTKGPPDREGDFKEKEGNFMAQSCRGFSGRNKYSSLLLLLPFNLLLFCL